VTTTSLSKAELVLEFAKHQAMTEREISQLIDRLVIYRTSLSKGQIVKSWGFKKVNFSR
jgi:hypothetical protein